MDFMPAPLQRYVETHTSDESPLLKRIDRETHLQELQPRMLSGHLQGRILSMISHMIRPEFILEIGTYTGYSAICLAEGMKDHGKLVTLDINEELEKKVKNYFSESGKGEQIEFILGEAQEIIPTLSYTWDLVFIDADKENYTLYYDLVIDQVRAGGYILADNVLWSGKVVDTNEQDLDTQSIRAFNIKIQQDPRVENVLLPVRDGLLLIRKK